VQEAQVLSLQASHRVRGPAGVAVAFAAVVVVVIAVVVVVVCPFVLIDGNRVMTVSVDVAIVKVGLVAFVPPWKEN
jgi:hypothetical protein